jgi:long-chain acyl-CoA synthetase
MTEASPIICGNKPGENDPLSIGPALDGVEIRLGESDELLARGPNIMLGYWNNPKATAETIDSEAWLHTGDQAFIDERGHVHITGRIKDIIVLSNGEKVPPADMEMAICANSLFEQAMVIGEGASYLSALLVLNEEAWPAFARECGVDPEDTASLKEKKVVNQVIKMLAELLYEFPGYAKVRRVFLTLEPWTIDNGLLTPTMKVKRARVLTYLQDEVDKLYENGKG